MAAQHENNMSHLQSGLEAPTEMSRRISSKTGADLEKIFKDNATDGKMSEAQFVEAFPDGVENEISRRLFRALLNPSKNGSSDKMTLSEFVDGAEMFVDLDGNDRIDYVLKLFDVDGDGVISVDELMPLFEHAFSASKLKVDKDEIEEGLRLVCAEGDLTNATKVGYHLEDLRAGVGSTLSTFAESVLDLKKYNERKAKKSAPRGPAKKKKADDDDSEGWCSWASRMWRFHKIEVCWAIFYIIINILAFALKWYVYTVYEIHRPIFEMTGFGICTARAFGQVASMNGLFLFWTMCRKLIAKTRMLCTYKNTPILPFNSSITLHKLAGHIMMLSGFGHVCGHLYNFSVYSSLPPERHNEWFTGPFSARNNAWFFDSDEVNPLYMLDPITNSQRKNESLWNDIRMGDVNPGWGTVAGTTVGATGHIMLVCMIIAYPLTFTRKKHFNFFWFSHHLFGIWVVAFMIHGLQSWLEPAQAIFFTLPGVVFYLLERCERVLPNFVESRVLGLEVSEGTTIVHAKKPDGFTYTSAGCYAMINIPSISKLEWHPFTISSSPKDTVLRFHIRAAGDWTKKLHELAKENKTNLQRMESDSEGVGGRKKTMFGTVSMYDLMANTSVSPTPKFGGNKGAVTLTIKGGDDELEAPRLGETEGFSPSKMDLFKKEKEVAVSPVALNSALGAFKINIHGALGAPTQDYFKYDVIVLVGAGIGVTPMSAVLRSLLYEYRQVEDFKAKHPGLNMQHTFAVQSVQFHWTTRGQQSLKWFSTELNELSSLDEGSVLEVHHHLTSVKPSPSQKLVTILQEGVHKYSKRCMISGIMGKFATHLGRPNWNGFFKPLAEKHPGKNIGVFYCGPPRLQMMLDKVCKANSGHKSDGKKAKFHFYAESF